jgi:phosphoribosylglycinamide formyltransferase 2
VVPEIEAIATAELRALEAEGVVRVVPTARAARLTMDREGIRRLAAETLGLATSPYRFCDSLAELRAAVDGSVGRGAAIGYPCVIKPVMSSSGKGQSKVDRAEDLQAAWDYAMAGGRVSHGRVIVEGFIDFDDEITLLTPAAPTRRSSVPSWRRLGCSPAWRKSLDGTAAQLERQALHSACTAPQAAALHGPRRCTSQVGVASLRVRTSAIMIRLPSLRCRMYRPHCRNTSLPRS